MTSELNGSQGRLSKDGARPGSALVVEHLTKRFGDRVAYEDVSFEVGYGEVFGFLGPNGAGKTTTVRTLGTLIAPTSGSATIVGIPLSADSGPAIRARISIMPESPGLYDRLTVVENLECFAGLYELRDVRNRIDRALEAVNLTARANDLCGSLSKGLRQRGVTIFLTTHRLEEAERLCHRVAILNTTMRLIGRPDELRELLFSRNLEVRTRSLLDDPGRVFTGLANVEGWEQSQSGSYLLNVTDPDAAAPEVARALVSANADILSIAESHHSLEDVYSELVDEDVEAKGR